MVDAGILREDEPIELVEGELVVVPPQGPSHAAVVADLDARFQKIYSQGFHVRVQLPVAGTIDSLPEPDFAIVRGAPRDYGDRHPTGADTVLVIEVARTSQAFDRKKAATYARAGVPTYWLVDLVARRLEVRTGPAPDGEYEQTSLLGEGQRVALPAVDIEWPVASLFL
jgi:Uma2 family endonuclease